MVWSRYGEFLALSWTHAVLGLGCLTLLTAGLDSARTLWRRRPIRRTLDATTGAVLPGFSARLAAEAM